LRTVADQRNIIELVVEVDAIQITEKVRVCQQLEASVEQRGAHLNWLAWQPSQRVVRVSSVQVVTVSFEKLFLDEYPKLVALGVSMSLDREIARELAQETMIRAYHRWDEIEIYDEPQAWLRRVMSNLLIDHHRSRKAERSAIRRLGDSVTSGGDGQIKLSEWAGLLAPLSPQQRIVATFYYADDLSIGEIARTLDISAGTVKSTLSKVRRRLRRQTGQHNDG